MDKSNYLVIKSTGEEEPFLIDKYVASLYKIGLTEEEVKKILKKVVSRLHNVTSTKQLYGITFDEIKKLNPRYASIYSLKEALRLLGPSGFPFERIVRELFIQQNYQLSHDHYIRGKCATHEIDVVATLPHLSLDKGIASKGKTTLVEVKFHVEFGLKSDIKIPLYVKARFDDIKSTDNYDIDNYIIVTNTKFTSNAINYSACAQVSLIAWNYPKKDNIGSLIQHYKLYPITVLHCLSLEEKQHLIRNHVILYQDLNIINEKKILPQSKLDEIYNEYKILRG